MKNHDKLFKDQETGVELDVVEKVPVLEWLVENYKNFGAKLEIVSDKSQEALAVLQGLKEFSSKFWRFEPILNKILNYSNLSNSKITSIRRSNVTLLRRVDVIFPNSKFRITTKFKISPKKSNFL